MDSFKQTLVPDSVEAEDKDDILDCCLAIESLENKIAKKNKDRRSTEAEEKDVEVKQRQLFEKIFDLARRVQSSLPEDKNKPNIGSESMKSIRSLYNFIEASLSPGNNVDEEELSRKINAIVTSLKMDDLDFEQLKVEKTPALSIEQPGAQQAFIDETSK
jgi:hypothetical protein